MSTREAVAVEQPERKGGSGRPKTRVYVDGFNLFYGSLRGHGLLWLDLGAFAERLNGSPVEAVIYCTAMVSSTPDDPRKAIRQQLYLRAVQTDPRVEVVLGKMMRHKTWRPLCSCGNAASPCRTRGTHWEEKGSDVNLGVRLVHDGHLGLYDRAILVTGDSDLVEPIRLVAASIRKPVEVVNPQARRSRELAGVATVYRQLDAALLHRSQFPAVVPTRRSRITRPPEWNPEEQPSAAKEGRTATSGAPCCPGSGALVVRCRLV